MSYKSQTKPSYSSKVTIEAYALRASHTFLKVSNEFSHEKREKIEMKEAYLLLIYWIDYYLILLFIHL